MSNSPDSLYEQMLEGHGLRKTAFRKEVLSIFLLHEGKALNNAQLEDALGDYDRITLYRTLKSFEDKGLVHLAVDSAGNALYALCSHHCDEESHEDSHAHFHCDRCGNTTCLDNMPEKFTKLVPEGYHVNGVQVTFSGICGICA